MANTTKSRTAAKTTKKTYKRKTTKKNNKPVETKRVTKTEKKVDIAKQRRINTYKNIIIILLIIILILLLLQKCGVYDNKKGDSLKDNYDIFEIDCDCKDEDIIDDGNGHNVNPPDDDNNPNNHQGNNNQGNNNQGNNNQGSNNQNNNGDNNSQSNNGNNNNNGSQNSSSNNNKESNTNDNNENNNNNNSNNNNNEDNQDEEPGSILVFDSNNTWENDNELHVFANPEYEMDDIIAPGSSNSYRFYIKNTNDCNIAYKLEFEEINKYGIHMKYKLKYNGEYIVSNWSSYNELGTEIKRLNVGIEDEYILEWKWEHSDTIDTLAGKDAEEKYKLFIRVIGEQIV